MDPGVQFNCERSQRGPQREYHEILNLLRNHHPKKWIHTKIALLRFRFVFRREKHGCGTAHE